MLWRLFSKAKAIPDRTHYRSAPSRSDGIGVQMVSGDGLPVSGRLIDMSAGGAAIEFDEGVEKDLVLEEQRKETRLEESRRTPTRAETPLPQRKIDFFDQTAGDTVIPPLPANEQFKPAAPVEESPDEARDFWDRKPVDRREQKGRRSS